MKRFHPAIVEALVMQSIATDTILIDELTESAENPQVKEIIIRAHGRLDAMNAVLMAFRGSYAELGICANGARETA